MPNNKLSDLEQTNLLRSELDLFKRPVSLRIEEARQSKDYYRRHFRASVTLLWIFLVGIALLASANFYGYFSRGAHDYYITRQDGFIFPLKPLANYKPTQE